jgi:hypothetical protein
MKGQNGVTGHSGKSSRKPEYRTEIAEEMEQRDGRVIPFAFEGRGLQTWRVQD